MVTVRIPVPVPSTMLVSNLLGLLGLAGMIVAIGALTDWRWALLAASVALLGLAVIGLTHAEAQKAPAVRPRPVALAAPAPSKLRPGGPVQPVPRLAQGGLVHPVTVAG